MKNWFKPTIWIVLIAVSIGGCGSEDDVESLLRTTISDMQKAAESRDNRDLMSYIRKDYQDEHGRTWKEIRTLAQYQFLRNKKLHIFKHVTQFSIDSNAKHATAVILVAMAGQPIDGAGSLQSLKADLMRFKVGFQFEEKWQVSSALWEPATAGDFLL